jgi:PTH1 family peptidyl-tRNA hydrolase
MDDYILFIGLGNPGSQYVNNRHNIGFRAIEAISGRFASPLRKISPLAESCIFHFEERKIVLAKPLTYMNLSGNAAKYLLDFYKIKSENTYVFHDDIDLDLGKVKIKQSEGSGGHNGIRSITSVIGANYMRVKIGVGRPENKYEVSSYVLGDFDDYEDAVVQKICEEISENMALLLNDNKKLEVHLRSVYEAVQK